MCRADNLLSPAHSLIRPPQSRARRHRIDPSSGLSELDSWSTQTRINFGFIDLKVISAWSDLDVCRFHCTRTAWCLFLRSYQSHACDSNYALFCLYSTATADQHVLPTSFALALPLAYSPTLFQFSPARLATSKPHTLFLKMKTCFLALAFASVTLAASTVHVVHESRASAPKGWSRKAALDEDHLLPMYDALAHSLR